MGFIIACFKNNKIKKVPLKLDSKERGLGIRNKRTWKSTRPLGSWSLITTAKDQYKKASPHF
jgi:hypothetical protein